MKLKLTILDPRFPALFFTGQLYNLMTNETGNAELAQDFSCSRVYAFSFFWLPIYSPKYVMPWPEPKVQFILRAESKFFEWSYGQTERALVMTTKPNFHSINKITDFLKYRASLRNFRSGSSSPQFESARVRVIRIRMYQWYFANNLHFGKISNLPLNEGQVRLRRIHPRSFSRKVKYSASSTTVATL